MNLEKAKLYIIGVGPGDSDLITLKALNLIKSCPIITYPVNAESSRSFAREIVAPHLPKSVYEYGFPVPMNKAREPAIKAYDEAASTLKTFLDKGNNVALLCEGDGFFYGSAMYLANRLSNHYEIEIVPGITSVSACAASIKRPLAARNERLKILPAPMDAMKLEVELANTEAAVIIKVGRHFEKVRTILQKLNLEKGAILIEKATGQDEKITPLENVEQGQKPYFSTILVYQGDEGWNKNDAE